MIHYLRNFALNGFTMIELLAAMAIFSILAVAMYGGTQWIVVEREIIMTRQAELSDLQRAVNALNNDFGQLRLRQIRDELGRDYLPALTSDLSREYIVELSHDGWRNPASAARGTLQRVRYLLEEPADEDEFSNAQETTYILVREYWPVMDRMLGMDGRKQNLLNDVQAFSVEYLDLNGEWTEIWPPAGSGTGVASSSYLPLAIRYRIESRIFGSIERTVEVPN